LTITQVEEDAAMRKVGDVSRKRRLFGGEARSRWYAQRRAERFARRFSVVPVPGR
jgi:hypothetical protein